MLNAPASRRGVFLCAATGVAEDVTGAQAGSSYLSRAALPDGEKKQDIP